VSDQLLAVFSEGLEVPADSLNNETSPENNESWDSLAAMNLVSLIEETFDVRLSTREIMKMRTIGIVREILQGKGIDV
jgi:acyl carrier protein